MPIAPSSRLDPLALLRGVSRSFYVSIRLLPSGLREPVALAYLLARATDTIADTTDIPADERRERLASLAAMIEGQSPAADAVSLASYFAPKQRDEQERALILELPACLAWLDRVDHADRDDILAVLRLITRGQMLDIERFAQSSSLDALQTAAQLDEYTYLVAGCVGEFWTKLCFRHVARFASLPEEEMRELGRAYGTALQLVNILRDAGADLASGRCYFPADELANAGLTPQEIMDHPDRFASVQGPWLQRARHGLAQGMRYCDAVHGRRLRAASAMPALLGARTLALLEAAGPQALAHRVKVPRAEVRSIMASMAFSLAGRAPLQAQFRRLQAPA